MLYYLKKILLHMAFYSRKTHFVSIQTAFSNRGIFMKLPQHRPVTKTRIHIEISIIKTFEMKITSAIVYIIIPVQNTKISYDVEKT